MRAIFRNSSDTEVICYLVTATARRWATLRLPSAEPRGRAGGAPASSSCRPTKLIAVRDPRGLSAPVHRHPARRQLRLWRAVLNAAGATLCGMWNPARSWWPMPRPEELRSITDHVGRRTARCACLSIYFSRPDSIIEGSRSMRPASRRSFLAQEHRWRYDVVIGVPDSGLDVAAPRLLRGERHHHGIGFIRNKSLAAPLSGAARSSGRTASGSAERRVQHGRDKRSGRNYRMTPPVRKHLRRIGIKLLRDARESRRSIPGLQSPFKAIPAISSARISRTVTSGSHETAPWTRSMRSSGRTRWATFPQGMRVSWLNALWFLHPASRVNAPSSRKCFRPIFTSVVSALVRTKAKLERSNKMEEAIQGKRICSSRCGYHRWLPQLSGADETVRCRTMNSTASVWSGRFWRPVFELDCTGCTSTRCDLRHRRRGLAS